MPTSADPQSMAEALSETPAQKLPGTKSATPGVERQIIRAVGGVAALLLIARTKADVDLWGHTRFGGDIVRDGFTLTDPYSFTSDIPWINHEWLAEVAFWQAWAIAGGLGLVALKMLLVIGTVIVVWRILRRSNLSPTAQEVLFLLVVVGTWPRTSVIRPQLFSLFLFALLLWVLQSVHAGQSRRLFWLPLVFLAWINLHGGWIVGFGVFSLWTVLMLLSPRRRVPVATMLLVAGLSVGALFLNPYGWDMLHFIATTVRIDRSDIADWQPIWHSPFLLGLWSCSVLVALFVLASRRGQVPLWQAAVVISLGLAALRVRRLDVFFTLAVAMLFGPHLERRNALRASAKWRLEAVLVGVATAIGIVAGSAMGQAVSCIGLDIPWAPERESGAFIQANKLKGRLLAWYDWGEYVIWHFGPALSISLDGRRETVYSDEFLKEHYALYDRPEQNLPMLDRLKPDYAWLPANMLLVKTLETQGWAKIFSGPKSVIFARQPGAFVNPSPPSGPACFPGP